MVNPKAMDGGSSLRIDKLLRGAKVIRSASPDHDAIVSVGLDGSAPEMAARLQFLEKK